LSRLQYTFFSDTLISTNRHFALEGCARHLTQG
jgi:hypothetical protein